MIQNGSASSVTWPLQFVDLTVKFTSESVWYDPRHILSEGLGPT